MKFEFDEDELDFKNDFEINQLIQIKNQKITQRTTIQLGEE